MLTTSTQSISFKQKEEAYAENSIKLPEIISPLKAATLHTHTHTHTHNRELLSDKTRLKRKKKEIQTHKLQLQGARLPYHIAAVVIHLAVPGLPRPKHLNSSSTACNITSHWLSRTSFRTSFPCPLPSPLPLSLSPPLLWPTPKPRPEFSSVTSRQFFAPCKE